MSNLYKTGQSAPHAGTYQFYSYLDSKHLHPPTQEERKITLKKGETFPPIKSTGEGAYWIFVQVG